MLDADEQTRRTLEATLTTWGMRAVSSGDIDEARTQLREAVGSGKPFEVVLIDFVLPRTNGMTFAAELGEKTEYGEPARILMSAFDAVGSKEAALAAGCAAYLLNCDTPDLRKTAFYKPHRTVAS